MKCFNHVDQDATATCMNCNKGLCVECSSRFSSILCEPCLIEHNKSVARTMYIGLAITVIIFLGFMSIFGSMQSSTGETLGYSKAIFPSLLFAFTFWGWKFLSDYFPRLTMGTGNVWILYFIFKFFAAYFIGLIVGPYQIFKMMRELNTVNKTKKQIESNNA